MTTKPRKNASGKSLLKYFMDKSEEAGRKYFPLIPWDERNISDQREFYSSELLIEAMDYYFLTSTGPWKVAEFLRDLPNICERMRADEESRENYKKLMQKTQERMREAGYEV